MGGIVDMADYVLNGSPSKSPAALPTTPSLTDAETQAKLDKAAQEQAASLARGRTSTMLTSGAGLTDMGKTSKLLLGQ